MFRIVGCENLAESVNLSSQLTEAILKQLTDMEMFSIRRNRLKSQVVFRRVLIGKDADENERQTRVHILTSAAAPMTFKRYVIDNTLSISSGQVVCEPANCERGS
jgi:hypothetical protein